MAVIWSISTGYENLLYDEYELDNLAHFYELNKHTHKLNGTRKYEKEINWIKEQTLVDPCLRQYVFGCARISNQCCFLSSFFFCVCWKLVTYTYRTSTLSSLSPLPPLVLPVMVGNVELYCIVEYRMGKWAFKHIWMHIAYVVNRSTLSLCSLYSRLSCRNSYFCITVRNKKRDTGPRSPICLIFISMRLLLKLSSVSASRLKIHSPRCFCI